ncbi:type II toxin-antitoxin system VapC family toxin [Candidatus Daviesbacteria bacterium]|nr:type II toxin-antitoxin system VapC family toxin [Candidatus Daviesbacteria bacterium]
MNYLIDTHLFLWALFSSKKISNSVKKILLNPQDAKYISAVTFWEISLKFQLKKIELKGALPDELPNQAQKIGFEILNLDSETVSSFYKLPIIKNRDPFDRMLAWQAINKDYCLLTQDPDFAEYRDHGLKVIW